MTKKCRFRPGLTLWDRVMCVRGRSQAACARDYERKNELTLNDRRDNYFSYVVVVRDRSCKPIPLGSSTWIAIIISGSRSVVSGEQPSRLNNNNCIITSTQSTAAVLVEYSNRGDWLLCTPKSIPMLFSVMVLNFAVPAECYSDTHRSCGIQIIYTSRVSYHRENIRFIVIIKIIILIIITSY